MESQLTVLHVDDDPSFLRLTGRRLDRDGGRVRVMTATTAEEAFDLLDGGRFDCVVSDSIRTREGESFVATLRRRRPDLPVVLFTGAEWERIDEEAREAGVSAYVRKGGDDPLSTLVARIEEIADDAPSAGRDTPGADPLGGEWRVVAVHDWESNSELVVTVVDAVDRLLGPDEGRMPLYDAVNGEALENLLRHRRERAGTTMVRFSYRGLDIAVTGKGEVAVRRPAGCVDAAEAETDRNVIGSDAGTGAQPHDGGDPPSSSSSSDETR